MSLPADAEQIVASINGCLAGGDGDGENKARTSCSLALCFELVM